jgi:hypothetical protein
VLQAALAKPKAPCTDYFSGKTLHIKPIFTMKKLTAEEASSIVPLKHSRETQLSAMLKQLQVGEAVVLEAKEWKTKSTPYRVANHIAERHGWLFEQGRMPDGSGWVFKRIA